MLDCRDYDIAMVNRFKCYFENTHWVQRPNISVSEIRNQKILNGKDICFPVITIRRTNCPIISKEYNSWSRYNTGSSYTAGNSKFSGTSRDLRIVDPDLANKLISDDGIDALSIVNSTFELTYYLDIIALERDNFDALTIEVQENILKNPYIQFDNIKSDDKIDKLIKGQACHLDLDEVEDNSEIDEFDSGNALYRSTLTLKLNAYIYRKHREFAVNKFSINLKVFALNDVNPAFDENNEPIVDTFKNELHYKIHDESIKE